LTPEESKQKILDFFSSISQEFPLLNEDFLADRVKLVLNMHYDTIPVIEDWQISKAIQKTKKPKSGVPGDLPKKIVQEFPVKLAAPVAKIFRRVLATNQWSRDWARELGIALKKTTVPATESETRIISLTGFWSKSLEGFVIDWLFQSIGINLNLSQYRGLNSA
jgi:hypothetical protein